MIKDCTNGKLSEITAYAAKNGLIDSFNKTFNRLENYSQKGCQVDLYNDFALLSLYFEISSEGKCILNGGFIFHGPHDGFGNGGAPTFSVCLDPEKEAGWSIHT
jgi:hypothetical protein